MPDRRMTAGGIVEPLDIVEHIRPRLVPCAQPPEGMMGVTCMTGGVSLLPRTAIQTPCERALSVGRSPHADRCRRRESHLALGNTDMQKSMDGLAMLVQEVLIDGNCTSAGEPQRSRLT
jgi:hypothetical protein